jgi:hypothetical protein
VQVPGAGHTYHKLRQQNFRPWDQHFSELHQKRNVYLRKVLVSRRFTDLQGCINVAGIPQVCEPPHTIEAIPRGSYAGIPEHLGQLDR